MARRKKDESDFKVIQRTFFIPPPLILLESFFLQCPDLFQDGENIQSYDTAITPP